MLRQQAARDAAGRVGRFELTRRGAFRSLSKCYHLMFGWPAEADQEQESARAMDVQSYKDALLRKRGEILGTGGVKPLQASMENNTRQGDMADQASGNNEVHIAAEAEADRREDSAGDRGGALAHREGHLRRVPRLRRADRRGAARTPFRGRASASPARKSRARDRRAGALAGVPPREAGRARSAPGGRAAGRPVRRQQHLPVHHQPRGHPAVVARSGDSSSLAATVRPTSQPGPGAVRGARPTAVARRGRARRQGVRRAVAAPRRGADPRAAPADAAGDPRRSRSSSSDSSSRRGPAGPTCSGAGARKSARGSAR